jgi:hypothetical protein
LGPVFFPRQGSLGYRTVHAHPLPVDAVEGVVRGQPRLPEAQEKAVGHPRLKPIMRGGGGTKPGGRERIPLAARSQHKEDRLGAHPIRHAGAATAKAVGVLVRGQERLDQRPKLVG